MLRLNVGCGTTPTPGWVNFDNSLAVRVGSTPGLARFAGLLPEPSAALARCARDLGLRWANAAKHIPVGDGCADVLYSSHMLEHLPRPSALVFLREAFRVLAPHGILRLAVPDLRRLTDAYVADGDADAYLERLLLSADTPVRFRDRLRLLVVGVRGHAWMFDAASVAKLVGSAGFIEVTVLPPGETRIRDPGALNLHERAEESVYVEAVRPPG
jgi:hypothetical protein